MSISAEPDVAGEVWRLLPFDRGPSTAHVALSDALARYAQVPTLWWHAADRPTIILGSGQSWSDLDLEACRQFGLLVVRRNAGGAAVYADDHVLGLDIALPAEHALAGHDVTEAYRWVGEAWYDTLRRFGVDVRIVSVAEARRKSAAGSANLGPLRSICFAGLSPYEVLVGDRKVVGLAQVRRRNGTLFQCGIQSHLEVEHLIRLLRSADMHSVSAELRSRAIGLDQVMQTPPTWDHIISTFHSVLKDTHAVSLRPGSWTPEERRRASEAQSLDKREWTPVVRM